MKTVLWNDSIEGTSIIFDGNDTVKVTVATVPFSKLTMALDLDDVDRLLSVVDHSTTPVLDLGEFFQSVFHCPPRSAQRAAEAFRISAPSLTETLR